jgi:hypothetical protein
VGGGVWSRKSVTDKKDGSLAIYIPSTKYFLLVDKKNAQNKMKKKIRQTNFSPRGQDGYSVGAPTLHSQLCLKIHLLILDSVGVPTL